MTDLILIPVLLLVSFVDIKTQTISDGITILGSILALNAQLFFGDIHQGILGLNCGILVMWILNLMKVQKVGGGDAKLLGLIGCCVGPLPCVFIALVALLFDKIYRKIFEATGLIPYAPFIGVAYILVRVCQMLI